MRTKGAMNGNIAESSSGGPDQTGTTSVLCVFVPGIKGSELWCDVCGHRSWPPAFIDSSIELARRVIARRTTNVDRLMNNDEKRCLAQHAKRPVRVIHDIRVMAGVTGKSVYGPFIRRLREDATRLNEVSDGRLRVEVVEYAYDWTRPNSGTARHLYTDLLLPRVRDTGYTAIVLVAHSMGGLVARYLLERVLAAKDECTVSSSYGTAEQCDAVRSRVRLFYGIGVPHYGCIRSLHNLVNRNDGVHSAFCRDIDSLYDMIPFSDIERQVVGLKVVTVPGERDAAGELARTRSDIFLKHTTTAAASPVSGSGPNGRPTGTEREITLDARYWRLVDRPKQPSAYDTIREHRIGEALASRFPELRGCEQRIADGAAFHASLDCSRKPANCTYIAVNAVGVNSPSAIKRDNSLAFDCTAGDGVVCSIVDNGVGPRRSLVATVVSRIGRTVARPLYRIRRRRLATRPLAGERLARRPVARNYVSNDIADPSEGNVHVTMLEHIDVFTSVRDMFLTNGSARLAHRLWQHVCRLNGGLEHVRVLDESRIEGDSCTVVSKALDNGNTSVYVQASAFEEVKLTSHDSLAETHGSTDRDARTHIQLHDASVGRTVSVCIHHINRSQAFPNVHIIVSGNYRVTRILDDVVSV